MWVESIEGRFINLHNLVFFSFTDTNQIWCQLPSGESECIQLDSKSVPQIRGYIRRFNAAEEGRMISPAKLQNKIEFIVRSLIDLKKDILNTPSTDQTIEVATEWGQGEEFDLFSETDINTYVGEIADRIDFLIKSINQGEMG